MHTRSNPVVARCVERRALWFAAPNRTPIRRQAARRFVLALILVAFGSDVAGARETAPPNAHPNRYGDGWECARGYRKQGRSCAAVEVPPNGFLDASGRDWECERGFQKGVDSCLALQVPANAHLSYSGDHWKCDPGYRQQSARCAQDEGRERP